MLGDRGCRGRPSAWRRGCKISAPRSSPPHALGCHNSLRTPHPREGISLTLLHCSCCGIGDGCVTEGCCPGWQRRLRGFLLSISPPQSWPQHGRSASSKSLLPSHCPAETLKGSALQCSPVPGSDPSREAGPTSPISEGFKCCFLQRVPGHPGTTGLCLS